MRFSRGVQLCTCRDVRINHQQMELFLAVFMVNGRDLIV